MSEISEVMKTDIEAGAGNPTNTFNEPAIRQEQQSNVLNPQQAVDQEEQLLKPAEKQLRTNKFRKAVASMMLGTALIFGSGMVEPGFAKEKQGMEQIEKENQEQREERRAVETLKELYELHLKTLDKQGGFSQAQNYTKKLQAIRNEGRDIVIAFGIEHKHGFQNREIKDRVTPREIKEGIGSLIKKGAQTFAAKYLGNKDGNFTLEKMEEWKKALNENPGLQIMMDMKRNLSEQ